MTVLFSEVETWVRRILKLPNNQDITSSTILDYFNRFYVYDNPAQLQLFDLKTTYQFTTLEGVDQYNAPVDQFQTFEGPFTVDGRGVLASQVPSLGFYGYSNQATNQMATVGDGTQGPYTFTVSGTPIVRGHTTLNGLLLSNVFIMTKDGSQVLRDDGIGNLLNGNDGIAGSVDYQSGAVSATFLSNVTSGMDILANFMFTNPSIPTTVNFYNNIFQLRPIPDRAYVIRCAAYLTPSAFASTSDSVPFGWMAEYFARGTARKIMSDFGDTEQLQLYEPFFKEQKLQVLRRTERQNSQQSIQTVYTSGPNSYWGGSGYNGWGW